MPKIYSVRQTKTPSMPNKTPSTPNKTQSTPTKIPSTPNKTPSAQFQSKEYAKKTNIDLRRFVAMQFLSRIYALFWRTFYRPKKYGGVPKMTNMRYGDYLLTIFFLENE